MWYRSLSFLKTLIFEPWPLWAGMLALTITNLYMFMFARALGVFPQMATALLRLMMYQKW